ncbi:hypothetical protein GFY24_22860 [Nocardia sp. SYP-A9097]|uniref:hypothetical protein n=1 Tax=Nocardia sp. SYP-A9097 TaxID=2663237 RepID=UPI00129B23B2|nr:hypothetical protein [Nocardia sp. SYP-A9097]MRH90244.1 hypothetical protein [Nocardia sp. SYP-A9097]
MTCPIGAPLFELHRSRLGCSYGGDRSRPDVVDRLCPAGTDHSRPQDAVLQLREMQKQNQGLEIDMDAVIVAARYVSEPPPEYQ